MPVRSFAVAVLAAVITAAACADGTRSALAPSAVDDTVTSANPDGTTLKVTAPAVVSPRAGEQLTTARPTLVFTNAAGRFAAVALQYRVEVMSAAGAVVQARVVPQANGGTTSWALETDLPFSVTMSWRVRAELDGQPGSWSATESFRTPAPPTPPPPLGAQPGSISIGEAFDIMVRIHDTLRIDLGPRSSRDDRIAFWVAAVAAVHYGHPRFNPRVFDNGWCIKDAGGGRPISDDVIVRCGSRDYWDLIGGVGASGYFWRIVYDGLLPGNQNVYAPPRSALSYLNR